MKKKYFELNNILYIDKKNSLHLLTSPIHNITTNTYANV